MKRTAEPVTEQGVSSDDDSQNSVKLLHADGATERPSTAAQSTLAESAINQNGNEGISQTMFYKQQKSPSEAERLESADDCAAEVTTGKKRKRKPRKKKAKQSDSGAGVEVFKNQRPAHLDFTPLQDLIPDSFFDQQDSSEDEGMPDYKIGGYHPVHVGELLLDRYVIIQKLGWGHFSTVWLTKDLKHNSYVAIKVQKSAQHYLEAAYDEVEILNKVSTNWQSESWQAVISKYYKDDPELRRSLEKHGHSGMTSHCVQLLNSFIH